MNKKITQALNKQIHAELVSAYIYLAMTAYFEAANLPGFANWMRKQSQEEYGHAMRLFNYVLDRDEEVVLEAIEKPPARFKSPVKAFEQALAHEQHMTGLINDVYRLAVQETDHATEVELQWFIQEQVEEEKTTGDIVAQLKMAGDHPLGLLMIDRELAQRGDAEDAEGA